jgi:hypothetical protein
LELIPHPHLRCLDFKEGIAIISPTVRALVAYKGEPLPLQTVTEKHPGVLHQIISTGCITVLWDWTKENLTVEEIKNKYFSRRHKQNYRLSVAEKCGTKIFCRLYGNWLKRI